MTADQQPVEPLERLIAAWVVWEDHPGHRGACIERHDALHAAGLPSCPAHELIGAARRAGYDVPSAIQTAVNELAPQEAA